MSFLQKLRSLLSGSHAFNLACSFSMLVLCLLFTADLLSLRGNPFAERQVSRKVVAESLAVQISSLLGMTDQLAVERAIVEFVRRSDDVMAAALTDDRGNMLVEHGQSTLLDPLATRSTAVLMVVPIYEENGTWGHVRVAYQPINRFWEDVRYFGFLGAGSLAVFFLFLQRALLQLDPSQAVPGRVNSAFNLFSEGVVILDADLRIMLANQAAARMIDLPPAELIGKHLDDWPWMKGQAWQSPWATSLHTGMAVSDQNLFLNSGDGQRLVVVSCTLVGEEDPTRSGIMVTLNDMSAMQKKNRELSVTLRQLKKSQESISKKNRELEALASLDPLTGLLNRRKLMDSFQSMFEHAQESGEALVCVMVDIDYFKSINDTYGHAVGDEVICAVAEELKRVGDEADIAGRYGGEEFALVLPNCTLERGVAMAEELRLQIARLADDVTVPVPKLSASLGLSERQSQDSEDSVNAMLERADKALYAAKQSGRNRVVAHEPEALDLVAQLAETVEQQSKQGRQDTADRASEAAASGKYAIVEAERNAASAPSTSQACDNLFADVDGSNAAIALSDGSDHETGEFLSSAVVSVDGPDASQLAHRSRDTADSSATPDNLSQQIDAMQAIAHRHRLEMEKLLSHDQTTQLPRRELFMRAVENDLQRAEQLDRSSAILSIEIKDLRRLQFSLGHAQCEALICEVLSRVQEELRTTDVVTRIGEAHSVSHMADNEYGILLSDLSGSDEVLPIITRLRRILQRPVDADGENVYPGFAIGIALYPECGESASTLIDAAISARLEAAGMPEKVAYHFASANMEKISRNYLQLESDLYQAVEQEQLYVYYQPKFNLATRTVTSVEALVRWHHPELGDVSPAEFIPVAENNGLVGRIFEQVLAISLAQLLEWDRVGFSDIRLSVNLSASQLRDPGLVTHVLKALDQAGLESSRLDIELTETSIIQSPQRARIALGQLNEAGVTISMDDFGTGYTSLGLLAELPLDAVKIDRSFVQAMQRSERSRAIIESVINMAHTLRLLVVAEGVENHEQLTALDALGCNEVQGYLISRPLSAMDMTQLLQRERRQRASPLAG